MALHLQKQVAQGHRASSVCSEHSMAYKACMQFFPVYNNSS